MRLSDVRGERTLHVIADLIVPVTNIAQDEKAKELFGKRECPKGMTPEDFVAERIKNAAPELLKSHSSDIIAIMSSIKGVTPEEYEDEMNMATVILDVIELFGDSEFMGFLASAMSQSESGSTSESTQD